MSNSQLSETDLRGEQHAESQPAEASGAGCVVRIGWLVVGPATVAVTTAILARNSDSSVVGLSAVYWGAVLAMIALRYLDVARLGGMTADGEPATKDDFRRYGAWVAAVTVALYVLALLLRR